LFSFDADDYLDCTNWRCQSMRWAQNNTILND
jgi:hypothetical protein